MRPSEGKYGVTLTVALCALIPFILITTAYQFYRTQLTLDIGAAIFLAPFIAGIVCFIALLFAEYHMEEPILPVKPMWNTLPVVGVIASMIGSGAYITLYVLAQRYEADVQHPSAGAPGMQKPDLRRWLKDDKPAWSSPELLAPARGAHPRQQVQRKAS